jgi:hypothetical protein
MTNIEKMYAYEYLTNVHRNYIPMEYFHKMKSNQHFCTMEYGLGLGFESISIEVMCSAYAIDKFSNF